MPFRVSDIVLHCGALHVSNSRSSRTTRPYWKPAVWMMAYGIVI